MVLGAIAVVWPVRGGSRARDDLGPKSLQTSTSFSHRSHAPASGESQAKAPASPGNCPVHGF
eukprot:6775057-Prorocentrum_lima.AAC.1